MAVTIGSNIAALQAQRRVAQASSNLSRSAERLSSGQRINRASDDAAGLAIASSLRAGSRVYDQATRNLNDGISALNIADSAVQDLTSLVTRMRELATQSANGTFSRTQRLSIHAESQALTDEYNRIVNSASFNGQTLLDGRTGQLNLQIGYGKSGSVAVSTAQGLTSQRGARTFSGGDQAGLSSSPNGQVVAGDFNNDGNIDLAVGDNNVPGVSIYLGNGDGSFSSIGGVGGIGGESERLEILDYNGDGNLDFVSSAGNTFAVCLGDGTGGFAQSIKALTGAPITDLAVGDIDGDGKDDVIVSRSSGYQKFLGNQAGNITQSGSTMSGNGFIGLADQDGDGKLDLISQAGGTIRLYKGNGAGGFGSAIVSTSGSMGDEVYTGDFNRDGIIDIIACGSINIFGDNTAKVMLGKSDGTFSPGASFSGFGPVLGAAAKDVDGDGLLDFVVGDTSGSWVFFGNGDGSFSKSSQLTATYGSANGIVSPLIQDFNNDGVNDIGTFTGFGAQLYLDYGDTTTTNRMKAINLTTRQGALSALDYLSTLSQNLQTAEATIGSGTSRLSAASGALYATRDGYTAAAGRITDADIASESASMTKQQILQQVASSVLSQANQLPALALRLLQ